MLLWDFYLGGDIRLDFFLNPGRLSTLGRHSTRCTSGTRTQDGGRCTPSLSKQPLPQMTNGTTLLLAWLRQSTNTGQKTANTMTSGPSTTTMRNVPQRRYVVHMR